MIDTTTDLASITALTRRMVRIPSQGGIDATDEIRDFLAHWLKEQAIPFEFLKNEKGLIVGLLLLVPGRGIAPPAICLNACLDTAPAGDSELWSHPPFSGEMADGWMYGRGSADSKVAVSIFTHLVRHFLAPENKPRRSFCALFDLDEHTGDFGGVKALVQRFPELEGVYIGYPGNTYLSIGGRGFFRAHVKIYGKSAHSGSSRDGGRSALLKAAHLIRHFEELPLPEKEGDFPLPPKLSITAMEGGAGFSVVPDSCRLNIDIRLTPDFNKERAEAYLQEIIRRLDEELPSPLPSRIEPLSETWPAYQLSPDSPLVKALTQSWSALTGEPLPVRVSGPSNIGNFLSAHGIPATCGFGVTYRNIHASDEAIELASITWIYQAYLGALGKLVG